MTEEIDPANATKTVITCEPVVDINSVGKLYQSLHTALENKHEIEIDASDVTRVDTSVLQTFTALLIEANATDTNVNWTGVSDTFYGTADLIGLVDEMHLPRPE